MPSNAIHLFDANIRAITFDVGGTLIRPWPSVGHIYAEVAARHGWRNLSPATLNRQFAAAWQALKNFNHTRAEWADLVETTFRGMADGPSVRVFFRELFDQFAVPQAWRIFDDVLPALDALATSGIKLGVISNWDERLRPLLQRLNLRDYFEVVVVSHEVGFTKPSRVIFEVAAEKLAVPSTAILHTGDSPEMDVRGAQAAGFHAVLLNRTQAPGAREQIASLRELDVAAARPVRTRRSGA